MGKKKKENRVGSVAYNRAHGLNKAAGGPGKSGGSPKPSPSPSPKPSPSPSPTPTPSPSGGGGGGGGGAVNRVGSVAYNRAHGLNKGAGGAGKSGGSPAQQAVARTNSFTNAQMAGNAGGAKGLVKARREAQKASGLSMKAYKAGVSSGFINKHGEKNTSNNSGGVSNGFGGSAWDNLNQNYKQEEWDAHVKNHWENYVDKYGALGDGLTKGPAFQAAQLGENGFIMDANAPIMIPKLGEYGFKAGDFAFDKDNYVSHVDNRDGRGGAGITGRIASVKKNGEVRFETDGVSGINPNWDKYAAPGSERMSSEGLYQDRYNVGYHGPDDEGDEYANNATHGSIAGYFKDYNNGKKSFDEAYTSFVDDNRKGGYAGDVLKLIDSGRMKVSDDQYNMIVTDAKNYDWDNRSVIAGRDAHGGGTYDSRVGGSASKVAQGAANFDANRAAGYHQAGTMDPGEAAATFGQNAQDYSPQGARGYQEQQNYQQNNMNYDFSQFMPSQQQGSKFQPWTPSNSYFDPYRFQQGQ